MLFCSISDVSVHPAADDRSLGDSYVDLNSLHFYIVWERQFLWKFDWIDLKLFNYGGGLKFRESPVIFLVSFLGKENGYVIVNWIFNDWGLWLGCPRVCLRDRILLRVDFMHDLLKLYLLPFLFALPLLLNCLARLLLFVLLLLLVLGHLIYIQDINPKLNLWGRIVIRISSQCLIEAINHPVQRFW
jgi:hypothetical protein